MIVALNARMKSDAACAGAVYLDYHSTMADEQQWAARGAHVGRRACDGGVLPRAGAPGGAGDRGGAAASIAEALNRREGGRCYASSRDRTCMQT